MYTRTVNYNGIVRKEAVFEGKILSINPNPRENANGKLYYVCTLEFVDANGEIQKTFGIIYDSNMQYGVEAGEYKMCTARLDENNNVYIQVSHLPYVEANLITPEAFGDLLEAPQPVVQKKAPTTRVKK